MISRRFARFVVTGAIGFVVDAGVLYAALYAGFGWYTGRLGSFLAAVLVTWLINRRWTFGAHASAPTATEFLRYLSAMSLGALVNYGTYAAIGFAFPYSAWLPLFAVGAGSIAGLAVNFTTASRWVFRDAKRRAEP